MDQTVPDKEQVITLGYRIFWRSCLTTILRIFHLKFLTLLLYLGHSS